MTCKMCGAELTASNRCKAHIFPRTLLRALSPDEYGQLKIIGTDMGRAKRKPIGSYDENILCTSCDGKLGIYDSYAGVFVVNDQLLPHKSGAGWTLAGVDHHKLKMFCISYIWRASVTKLAEFKGVDLGQAHEAKIRQMLLKDNSGTPSDYTTSIQKFHSADDKLKFGGILFPAKTRIKGLTHYEAYLPNGYKIWVKVDSRVDAMLAAGSLGAIEPMIIGNRGDFRGSVEQNILLNAVKRSSR